MASSYYKRTLILHFLAQRHFNLPNTLLNVVDEAISRLILVLTEENMIDGISLTCWVQWWIVIVGAMASVSKVELRLEAARHGNMPST